ncbi:MAG TPA: hypothetical protein VME66_01135 [Candidatus Acidoferrales bacterium]|nr:hypothetical protein [Candidatus Acidoferrales bacterium]
MARFITGVFHDRAEAERTVEELEDLGYERSEISVITNEAPNGSITGTKERQVATDATIGATYGGALGAILAGVAATGTIVATGGAAAPLIAGPAAAALAGLGAGGAAGGVIGALVGVGIPEDHAKHYERELAEGGLIIGVTARPGDEPNVRAILEDGAVEYADDDEDDELVTETATHRSSL